jgi:hypothetical protein
VNFCFVAEPAVCSLGAAGTHALLLHSAACLWPVYHNSCPCVCLVAVMWVLQVPLLVGGAAPAGSGDTAAGGHAGAGDLR